MFQLNSDQKNFLKFILAGHNVLVTGQAGAGKSEVVRESIKRLNEARKNVAVVCSSGIACQVYERGVASTVHSYYGFQAANEPWKQIGFSRLCL
jgi:Cdc6-like AAA superfamily ATPase